MLFITLVEQWFQGRKIQECGMLWVVAMKKWVKQAKLPNALQGPRILKIEKVLLFIKWQNFII